MLPDRYKRAKVETMTLVANSRLLATIPNIRRLPHEEFGPGGASCAFAASVNIDPNRRAIVTEQPAHRRRGLTLHGRQHMAVMCRCWLRRPDGSLSSTSCLRRKTPRSPP